MNELVFISYSRSDRSFVDRLLGDFEKASIKVWIDRTGLKPGTHNWDQAIREAIRHCRAVLLIASPNSRQSDYVQGELNIAEMYARPIYPIWVAGEYWADCISLDMTKTQYIDARGDAYSTALELIIQAVQTTPQERIVSEAFPGFEPRNPYKGLHYFTAYDRKDFFGRERFIQDLIEKFPSNNSEQRFLALVGPSGSGKSSAVMAGLLPALQDGVVPNSNRWIYLNRLVPGTTPLENLAISLKLALPESGLRDILDDLEGSARGLHKLTQLLAKDPLQKVVLFVDQFEELFTATVSEDERRQFINLLVVASSEPRGAAVVILTLRADFYDRPMSYPALGKLLEKYSKSVLRMEVDELREVIQKPVEQRDVQVTFEQGLIGDLLFDAQGQVGSLPLLQFTLDQLFERRHGHLLTISAYHEIGGLRGALAKHAELTYQKLPTIQHGDLARSLFLRLIDPGTTEQDTRRRRASLRELEMRDLAQTQMMQIVYETFVRARLLVTDQIAGETIVEVSHEALIREWDRLAKWLREARDDVRFQQMFSNDVKAWQRRQKSADYLYYGAKLRETQNWLERNSPSRDELEFVEASLGQEQERVEQGLRRQRRLQRIRLSGHLISSSEPSRGVLELIVREAAITFDVAAVSVSLCEKETQDYTIQASFGLPEEFVEKRLISAERYASVIDSENQHDPVYVQLSDSILNPQHIKTLEEANIYGFLLVPLIRGRHLAGGLELYPKGNIYRFGEEDIEFAQVFASQISIALDNIELIDTLRQRVVELADAREQALYANRAKSQFLAAMSHELRTPLNSSIGYTELILSGNVGDVNEKQEEYLNRVLSNSRRLLALINDTLDLTKVEAGVLRLFMEIVNLSEIVSEIMNSIDPLLKAKTIQFVTDVAHDLYAIKADKQRLKQILLNLLSNAIKFTEEGSIVLRIKNLTVGQGDDLPQNNRLNEGTWIVIEVEDTGIGISPESQEQIFSEFQVLSSPTKHYGGIGLGLSITKRLVEMHKGIIWFESEVGKGSAFHVALPVDGDEVEL